MIVQAADGRGFVYTKVFECGHEQPFYLHKSEVVRLKYTLKVQAEKDQSLKCRICTSKEIK